MSSLPAAFDAPVRFTDYGLDLSLPKLDLDDHAAWCAELHAVRKPLAMKLIPGNAQPTERFKMQRAVEYGEPTLDDIADLLYTPKGARDCLKKSLIKSGKNEAEAGEILKKIPPGRAQSLAIDVSGLFERVPPPPTPEQGAKVPDPLAQGSGSGGATSPSPTGDGPASSSPSTSGNPSVA